MKWKFFFKEKNTYVNYKNRKLLLWDKWYWMLQIFVSRNYRLYYSKFAAQGLENIPKNKPVLFAISHRNAFMDSLAFVTTSDAQIFQLARGDAWDNKFLGNIFYFFHMLPLWREHDGVDTKAMNYPTFETCYDVLAKNGMVGIYPEGNCINENHIRPLKKGICRIAFGAEEKYNWELDIHVVPVVITYTGAEKFKKWAIMNVGEPVLALNYKNQYLQNNAAGMIALKNAVESGMKRVSLHIPRSEYFNVIEELAFITARNAIEKRKEKYNPYSKLQEEKEAVEKLEIIRNENLQLMAALKNHLHTYKNLMLQFNFRENTFDAGRNQPMVIIFMFLYFIFMLPVFIYGLAINYPPYLFTDRLVMKKIKQKIFYSSLKFATGIFLFPVYYIILASVIWLTLGSFISALLFLISFPVAGHVAFYYWFDLKKWISAARYRKLKRKNDESLLQLLHLRNQITDAIFNFDKSTANRQKAEKV